MIPNRGLEAFPGQIPGCLNDLRTSSPERIGCLEPGFSSWFGSIGVATGSSCLPVSSWAQPAGSHLGWLSAG